jgi:hypothetical protein
VAPAIAAARVAAAVLNRAATTRVVTATAPRVRTVRSGVRTEGARSISAARQKIFRISSSRVGIGRFGGSRSV